MCNHGGAMDLQRRRAEVGRLLREGLDKTAIARRLGVTRSAVRRAAAACQRAAFDTHNPDGMEMCRPAGYGGVTYTASGCTFVDEGNAATVERVSTVKTLDALIAAAEVDLDVWKVERWVANKWDQAQAGDDGPVVIELWQVKAWLVRKVAVVTDYPPVQPVHVALTTAIRKPRHGGKIWRTALVVPDSQNGYVRDMARSALIPIHDRMAWSVVLQLAEMMELDDIILMGDMLDCTEWTDKFVRSPEFYYTTQPALVELAWLLGQLRMSQPAARMVYIPGNHEKRLSEAIAVHLPQAYGLRPANAPPSTPGALSVPSLLGLRDMDIEYLSEYPRGELWLNNNVVCTHGEIARAASGATVGAVLREARASEVVGHIHRNEQASVTRFGQGGPLCYTAVAFGTLARIDGVVPASKARINWQQGCGIVYYETDTPYYFQPVGVPINAGRALFYGDVVEAEDYVPRLRKDTRWAF